MIYMTEAFYLALQNAARAEQHRLYQEAVQRNDEIMRQHNAAAAAWRCVNEGAVIIEGTCTVVDEPKLLEEK